MTDLILRTSSRPDRVVIAVLGALDQHTASAFRARMRRILETVAPRLPVVVDLRCCTHADPQGLLALVDVRSAARGAGGDLRLEAVPPLIELLIQLRGLDEQLPTSAHAGR